jgi:recombinational DNA repair protein RecR
LDLQINAEEKNIATSVPADLAVEYADEVTMSQAIEGRREL